MATYEVDLLDGSTVDIEADSIDGAIAEQQRLNAEISNPTPRNTSMDPTFMQEAGAVVSGLPQNALTGLAEMGSSVGRNMAQGFDFLTSPLQALDNATGDRIGTIEQGYEGLSAAMGSPTGGYMAEGTPRDVVRGYGGAMPAALGMAPVAGRNLATPAGAAMDMLGFGSASGGATVAPMAFDDIGRLASDAPSGAYPVPATPPPATTSLGGIFPTGRGRQAIDELVQEGSESARRAGYALDPYTGRSAKDAAGRRAMGQGVDDDIVAMLEASNPATRQKMLDMLGQVEKGREFRKSKSYDRASDVIGDSLLDRLNIVRDANKSAANQLEPIANSLKGESIDAQPAVSKFISELDRMGVKLDQGDDGILAQFANSDVEGLTGPINAINKMVSRMANTKVPDAHDAHRLKRYIDEVVTYGKNAEGLDGNVERILKGLRYDLNSALGDTFPEYAKANKAYSESIQAIDALQDVAGTKMDLSGGYADKALGTLMRRLTSNAQSRVPLMYATEDLDALAKKYTSGTGTDVGEYAGVLRGDVPDLNDDLRTMAEFASELEGRFGSAAGTSFLGEIGKAGDRTAEMALDAIAQQPTMMGMLSSGLKSGYRGLRGINEENALKRLRELLEK